jgi:hypothetical protein
MNGLDWVPRFPDLATQELGYLCKRPKKLSVPDHKRQSALTSITTPCQGYR